MPVNLFNANYYRAANSDLAGMNDAQAMSHFQNYGLAEGRAFSSFVDLNFYRSSNSDLANFNNSQAFEHLQNYGVVEGRRFSQFTDLNFYRSSNSDLAGLDNGQALQHLEINGVGEGRVFSQFFNINHYRASNADLMSLGLSSRQLLEHFKTNGLSEGRTFSQTFDVNYYRDINSDLAAVGLNNQQLYNHFQLNGLGEGRGSSQSFNVSYYLANNSDLIAAGFTKPQAYDHFLLNGQREGRFGGSDSAGNTLGTARNITVGALISTFSDGIGYGDARDFYRFTADQSGVFTANLTELTGDADIRLIQDSNLNGAINQGEVRAWQWERGSGNESIRSFLSAGTYFLEVVSYNQTSNYSLATGFTAAASDDRHFSIQVNFDDGIGLTQTHRDAVFDAARMWEQAISHSSFSSNHSLTIELTGSDQGGYVNGATLASAGWRHRATDLNGRLMPTTGSVSINTNSEVFPGLTANINYFRNTIAHEFGHVLGIGTLWEEQGRNFVNRATGTYNPTTYAGWAYAELSNTFVQTAVPLTTGVGEGSDYSHWREEIFNAELMTHEVEQAGTPMPLSQLTIASLKDIGWNVNYGAAEPYSVFA